MMTSMLRITVSTEMKNNKYMRTTSDCWSFGFLQEALRSCGKQSSALSWSSILRERRRRSCSPDSFLLKLYQTTDLLVSVLTFIPPLFSLSLCLWDDDGLASMISVFVLFLFS
ncbi:hypothetical protein [Paraclostridium dentum]|uniref:hypothetical protein n=1 Tax=Paraclostridium dentum TaxID=2662455 RepID=UPI003F3FD758